MTRPVSPRELKAVLEAERKQEPFLVYRDAAGDQIIFPLPSRTAVSIGRTPDADLTIQDDEISRLHAKLEAVGETWTVVDDGLSTNGTFLNGQRISGHQRLVDRDTLRLGRTSVSFRHPAQQAQGTTVRATDVPSVEEVSPTQRRVLVALCRPYKNSEGFVTPATNQQIANELFLSTEAIKKHLRVLYLRYNLDHLEQNQKRAKLAELALHSGLVAYREL